MKNPEPLFGDGQGRDGREVETEGNITLVLGLCAIFLAVGTVLFSIKGWL